MMREAQVLSVCLLLVGCRLHQVEAEPPPPVPVPESFRNAGGEAEAPDRWWESFGDPALNTTIEAALSDNLSLRAAWARIEQGIALARKQGAAYWPQLEAGLGVSGQRFYVEQPDMSSIDVSQGLDNVSIPTTTEGKDAANLQLSVSAAWEADLWGRIASMEDAALHDQLAGREDLSAAAASLAAQVAETWFMLAEQSALLGLLHQQLAANHTLLELVEMRFTQGVVQAIDVRQQRQRVSSMESELPLIEGRLEILRTRLAVLSGVPPQQDITMPSAELPLPPALPSTGLPLDLLTRRPDVRAARLRVTAADHRVGAAIADQFPALRLSGKVGFSDDAIDTLFLRWIYNLAANLIAPIFDGGRRSAEVARTQAVVKERVNTFGQVVLEALKEVEDALVLEARQHEHLTALERSVEQARQTLQAARTRYVSGLTDYLPVLGALQTLQTAERREVSARRQRLSYRIQLHRALGGAWVGELTAHDAPVEEPTESP
jgi:multidrug efflux system outer membrane protein